MRPSLRVLLLAFGLVACAPSGAHAQQLVLPANDLNPLLALTGTQSPATVPTQKNPEPPLTPAPRATCGAGSRELKGVQGRVPMSAVASPEAERGWTCNVSEVSHVGGAGGFRVWRYVDRNRHECAYYDTSLLHPANAIVIPGLPGTGVAVLDMTDPAHPVQTALLDTLPMQAPHESLNLNAKRGLLAAELGSGGTAPGLMSIYDVSGDCRRPVLQSTTLAARFGHESGWAPDGNTFWIGGGVGLAAIDVTNPKLPHKVWEGNEFVHGPSASDDGNRLYLADPIDGELTIVDVSEVQARKPDPVVREVSRLTWKSVSIPQNTAPMLIGGHRYLLEFDEFGWRFTGVPQDFNTVGGARIVDIADEKHPRVVSNLRLAVNQPAERAAALGDPGALSPVQSYGAHYCAIPREVEPEIVACTFINSGLRIFDIRDPLHPREVGYYVSPPTAGVSNLAMASDFAMSMPAFAPERREVWYSDAISGFYALRLDNNIWPHPLTASSACKPRAVVIHFPGRPKLRSFKVTVAGKRVAARRSGPTGVRVTVKPRRDGRATVVVKAVTKGGRHVTAKRRVKTCSSS